MAKDMLRRHAANGITVVRMAASVYLAFLRPLSPAFLRVYTAAGVTDALDGFVARKTGTASDQGARLDSVADLLFYAVTLARLLPIMARALPAGIFFTAAGIFVLRLAVYCAAALRYRRVAAAHTYLNKLTGAMVLLMAYVLPSPRAALYGWAVCTVAAAAALEELALHLTRPTYDPDIKTIFQTIFQKESME